MKATTRTVKADGEFKVKLFIDGVYQVNCDYFTDDQEDARQTAEQMTLHAVKNDTPLVILKDVGGHKILDYTSQRNILLSNGFEQCEIDECFEDYNY